MINFRNFIFINLFIIIALFNTKSFSEIISDSGSFLSANQIEYHEELSANPLYQKHVDYLEASALSKGSKHLSFSLIYDGCFRAAATRLKIILLFKDDNTATCDLWNSLDTKAKNTIFLLREIEDHWITMGMGFWGFGRPESRIPWYIIKTTYDERMPNVLFHHENISNWMEEYLEEPD